MFRNELRHISYVSRVWDGFNVSSIYDVRPEVTLPKEFRLMLSGWKADT
jgi:hypothetical protein